MSRFRAAAVNHPIVTDTTTLLPGATRFEARTLLASLTHGQRVLLTIDGRTNLFEVERSLGSTDPGGEHPDSNGVTFLIATGARSYRNWVTVAQVAAGFSPTITTGAEPELLALLERRPAA